MYIVYGYGLASVVLVSLISLVGVFTLAQSEEKVRQYISFFISLAVGALLGDAFIHLIPESFEGGGSMVTSLSIIGGIFLFLLLEKFLHWHHHEDDSAEYSHVHPVGKLVLFSDGVHNFIDGVVIGVSFLVSVPVGIATTLAVILHEIPQEIGDFAVLIHAGYSRTRALWLNFLSALSAVAGLGLAFVLGSSAERFIGLVLPFAAGGFIYIALADLIPELHKTKKAGDSFLQMCAILLGVLAMIALVYLE